MVSTDLRYERYCRSVFRARPGEPLMKEPQKYAERRCPRCGALEQIVNPVWLRHQRTSAGVSLRAFAKRLGFSAPYVSDIERGQRGVTSKIKAAYEQL